MEITARTGQHLRARRRARAARRLHRLGRATARRLRTESGAARTVRDRKRARRRTRALLRGLLQLAAYQTVQCFHPAFAGRRRLPGESCSRRRCRCFTQHILVKEPGTAKATPWHQDLPYYCVDGLQTASYWIPLDPVTRANTLRVVAASSHCWPRLVRPKRWASNENFYGGDDAFMEMPDVEDGSHIILQAGAGTRRRGGV
ncbi:phytanoyl-CoA dioxygenase family protein [Cupriavidus basilensis]